MEDQKKQTKEEHFDGGLLKNIPDPVVYMETKKMVYPMKHDSKRFPDLLKDG